MKNLKEIEAKLVKGEEITYNGKSYWFVDEANPSDLPIGIKAEYLYCDEAGEDDVIYLGKNGKFYQ